MSRFNRPLFAFALLGLLSMQTAAQPEVMVLPERPANAHWLWINDLYFGQYNRAVLYDVESGHVLGAVGMGFEGPKLEFSRSNGEIYSAAVYYSRGYRGKRTQVLEVFDGRSLQPLREIELPGKLIRGWPDPTVTAISDDDRFYYAQFFTPASSIGVVDVKNNKFTSDVETSGCAHIMPAGDRRFFTLCGDGSILAVTLDDSGKEASRKRYPGFFDADADPVHGSGFRSGDVWYFVSTRGQIHSVNVSGRELEFLPKWQVAEQDGDKTWVPGAFRQSVAVHRKAGKLYLAMHLSDLKPLGGGVDFLAKDGTKVCVYDLKSKKLERTFQMQRPVSHLSVSQDDAPLLYVADIYGLTVSVFEERTGKHVRDILVPLMPGLLQPVN